MIRTLVVDVSQPRLSTVGSIEPAQVVIERAVFHHHNHDVLDPDASGVGSPLWAPARRIGPSPRGCTEHLDSRVQTARAVEQKPRALPRPNVQY